MSDWKLEISTHWPHDRFAFGWEYIRPSDEDPYSTFTLYLGILTLSLDIYEQLKNESWLKEITP